MVAVAVAQETRMQGAEMARVIWHMRDSTVDARVIWAQCARRTVTLSSGTLALIPGPHYAQGTRCS